MESSNILDESAVAIQDKDQKIVGHPPLGKSKKFAKIFLKADKNQFCRISVTGKAVNAGNGLWMKVPCRLYFIAEERYINVLKEKLSVQLLLYKEKAGAKGENTQGVPINLKTRDPSEAVKQKLLFLVYVTIQHIYS